jgi:hypothetical protein
MNRKNLLLAMTFMIPHTVLALQFQPELAAEIERVKSIYKADLKLDTHTFCGIYKERTSYFNGLENHLASCNRFKNRIIRELQCLNNTKKTLKKDLFPRVSVSYFVDNEGMTCFTESFINSNENRYGVESEKASEDMYKAISKNLQMKK